MEILEKAVQEAKLMIKLVHGYYGKSGGYDINFTEMTQLRLQTGNKRKIRRVPAKSNSQNNDQSNNNNSPQLPIPTITY